MQMQEDSAAEYSTRRGHACPRRACAKRYAISAKAPARWAGRIARRSRCGSAGGGVRTRINTGVRRDVHGVVGEICAIDHNIVHRDVGQIAVHFQPGRAGIRGIENVAESVATRDAGARKTGERCEDGLRVRGIDGDRANLPRGLTVLIHAMNIRRAATAWLVCQSCPSDVPAYKVLSLTARRGSP